MEPEADEYRRYLCPQTRLPPKSARRVSGINVGSDVFDALADVGGQALTTKVLLAVDSVDSVDPEADDWLEVEPADPRLPTSEHIFALSPELARELAGDLLKAADEAERRL